MRLPGGGAVHGLGIARRGGGRGLGLDRLDGAVRAAAAQVQGEFTGQDDAAGAGGQQQAAGQQPLDRALRVLRGDRAGGVRDGAGGRAPDQPLQQPQRGLGGGGEQRVAAGAVAEQRGERGDGGDRVGRRGLPGGGEQLLEAGRGHAGARLGEGRAEAGAAGVGGGRRERLAGRDDQAQAVVRAPEQGPVAQRGQGAGQRGGDGGPVGGAQRGGLGVRLHLDRPGQQGADGGRRGAVGERGEGLGDLEGEPVQPLQRAQGGGAGGQPGGELGEVAGHGVEQVGAGPEQGGEVVVGTGAQFLGEGAGAGDGLGLALGALLCGHST